MGVFVATKGYISQRRKRRFEVAVWWCIVARCNNSRVCGKKAVIIILAHSRSPPPFNRFNVVQIGNVVYVETEREFFLSRSYSQNLKTCTYSEYCTNYLHVWSTVKSTLHVARCTRVSPDFNDQQTRKISLHTDNRRDARFRSHVCVELVRENATGNF
jgi:hypothetical protein